MSEPRGLQTVVLCLLLAAVASVVGCVLAWSFAGSVPWLRYVAWVLSVPAGIVALLVLLTVFDGKIYKLIRLVRALSEPRVDYHRQATPDDAEAIAELEQAGGGCPGGRGSEVTGDLAERAAWWRAFLSVEPTMNYHDGRTQVAFVAAYGVGVKAYVAIQFHPGDVELVGLYCDPAWYPKANHRTLVLHAFERMRNCSRYKLWAKVKPDDPRRAVYAKLGAEAVAGDPERVEWRAIEPRFRLRRGHDLSRWHDSVSSSHRGGGGIRPPLAPHRPGSGSRRRT
ncbi:MAG TPA: hypothetical protein VF796_13080 [Humisphaera sp.]